MNSPDTKDSPMTMPTFEVVVWIKKTDAFEALRDELIGFAVEEPDESTEDEGVVDFHWGFDKLEEAASVAEVLTALSQRPELLLLRMSSRDDPTASTVFKDTRYVRH
jgi:hypothetical protein